MTLAGPSEHADFFLVELRVSPSRRVVEVLAKAERFALPAVAAPEAMNSKHDPSLPLPSPQHGKDGAIRSWLPSMTSSSALFYLSGIPEVPPSRPKTMDGDRSLACTVWRIERDLFERYLPSPASGRFLASRPNNSRRAWRRCAKTLFISPCGRIFRR
jgi:hypothetical protein